MAARDRIPAGAGDRRRVRRRGGRSRSAPPATVLAAVDLELTDDAVAAMEAWIAQDRKRETLPVHRYSAADFGLTDGADPGAVRRLHARGFSSARLPRCRDIPSRPTEQHEHEKAALQLWEHPVVAEAREVVRADWLEKEQPSPVMRDCFDWAFEEVMFSATIWSSNQDPLPSQGHVHHPPRARGRRAAHPRHAVGHRQPRLDLPGHPDLGRRALRDPRPRRRAPDDRELLHPVGRQHGHRGPAQRPRPRDRGRRLVRRHRRRRSGRRRVPTTCSRRRRRTSSTSAT